jgi:hypothetical protein
VEPAATIGRLGFRRWYERQLIEGHAWLITCFLCMLAIAACVEVMSFRGPPLQVLSYAAAVAAGCAIGVFSWRRYLRIMTLAEYLGEHATCTSCRAYARFSLIGADATSMTVRCRKCAHEWRID